MTRLTDSLNVDDLSLAWRLRNPSARLTPEELCACWFDQTVCVRLSGLAPLVRDFELFNHFRRSFGGGLRLAASEEARANLPCPWNPPCALDVFFREQVREERAGLPKPFVMLADADSDDLIAGLRVFGFATEWLPAAEHAFIAGLRDVLPWRKLGRRAPEIADRWIETCEGFDHPLTPKVTLRWITPLDAEKINPHGKPASILSRLVGRAEGIARWFDAALEADKDALAHLWTTAIRSVDDMEPRYRGFHSGQDRKTVRAKSSLGSIALAGDIAHLWPLMLIGERIFVGRGAARGCGRYGIVR